MATIRRVGDRCEIRECIRTERGPRQHTLASFRGALTPEVLDAAEDRARRPFRREDLVTRARALGIPVALERHFPEARALIAQLHRGVALDPILVTILRAALERLPAQPVPEHLQEAAEWIGRSEREHGHALRGLVRTADRIARSRGPLREPPREVFPRFTSRPKRES